jgi:hypothetical protein
MDEIDDILNGNDEAEAVETPQPETQPEAAEAEVKTEGPARDEKGRFASKGEKEPEAPEAESPSAKEEPQIDHPALIGERRRRQEAEDRLRHLEQQFQQMQQPQQFQQPAEAPDMFEDPQGYTQWIQHKAAEQATARAYEQFQYQRINTSAAAFAPNVPDYAEKVQVFQQLAQGNPALLQELYRTPNPAEFAYNTAKQHLEISQYGGIEGLIKARV